jgi:purine-binding chemotaxis protein CheW
MIAQQQSRTGDTDWRELRERLGRAVSAIEESVRLSPKRAKEVMEERTRALARVPTQPARATDILEIVTFALAQEYYGIEARYVREVIRLNDFTPIPGTPDFFVGVTNLRGEILAIVDLRKFLGVAPAGLSDLSRVVVLGVERAEFGVLADAMHGVATLPLDGLLEPPGSVSGVGREYLCGVTKDALVVLDGAVLLNDTRLFIDQSQDSGA